MSDYKLIIRAARPPRGIDSTQWGVSGKEFFSDIASNGYVPAGDTDYHDSIGRMRPRLPEGVGVI
ncbi:MAG: hypothetical protein O3B95_10140 [Chloroflexi bacterium]|nr:hypothetical protein [Chloroflexota bacterium]